MNLESRMMKIESQTKVRCPVMDPEYEYQFRLRQAAAGIIRFCPNLSESEALKMGRKMLEMIRLDREGKSGENRERNCGG